MKQTFTIVLEGDDADTTPVIIRLRQLLKLAGRAFKLKCTEAREVGTETTEATVGDDDTGRLGRMGGTGK